MEEYLNTVLRPLLQGDGGEIEYVNFDGETLCVRLRGECSKCGIADRCIKWCGEKILRDTGKKVAVVYERKKPFFWDK